ncbi:hypothetical protein TSA66_18980 [Noviherbaspirillum autotrophicum]|uniref:Uncharacterized protein n=1 Tax=Noviherbaspirillum autotrophicum TaxID=709839 RepID=A0A0C1Y672_9BURK|nr:hypothetical protein TSA66_18980 [Noviherbaspirillum autotrophicum]
MLSAATDALVAEAEDAAGEPEDPPQPAMPMTNDVHKTRGTAGRRKGEELIMSLEAASRNTEAVRQLKKAPFHHRHLTCGNAELASPGVKGLALA